MGLKISMASARVNAKLTQTQVAKALGVSTGSIVNWEKGKNEPSYTKFVRFCELCGVSVDDIFLPK